MEKAQASHKPYCLYLEYPSPHNPYLAPPGFEQMYDPAKIQLRKNWEQGARRFGTAKDIAGYYAAIACLDREIGRVLSRIDKDTLVVFTSDHGDMLGSHGKNLKRKPWEESVRVPGIVRWPNGIKIAKTTEAPLSHVDVVPTLLGLTGTKIPRGMHGFDYSDFLRGKSTRTPAYAHLMMYTATEDDEFAPWRGLRSKEYKYAEFRDRPWLLYDLEKDPYEMNNLVDDSAHQNLIRMLHGAVKQQMERTGDRWDEQHDAKYT
jgi:arylsulfatase A-like enzyme